MRHPHPLGALGRRVPLCLKLPNNITSLFDGQISYKNNENNIAYRCIKTRPTILLFRLERDSYIDINENLIINICNIPGNVQSLCHEDLCKHGPE